MILDNRYLYDILTGGKTPGKNPAEQAADRRIISDRGRRFSSDIPQGLRAADSVDRSAARIHTYQALDTIEIETGNQTVQEIPDEICVL